MFSKNVGAIDRTIRIILGIGILSLVFWGPHTLWGFVGLILIGTGFIRFCPIYRALGICGSK